MSGCNGSQNRSFFKKPVTQDSESVIKLEQICHKYAKVLFSVFWWQLCSGPRLRQEQLDSYRVWFLLSRLSTSAQKVIRSQHSLGFFFFLAFCSIKLLNKVRAASGDIREETQSRKHTSGVLFTPVLSLVIFIFSYVYEYFACMYTVMYVMDVPGACRSEKRTSDSLEPQFQIGVGTGNWIWGLCKSRHSKILVVFNKRL